MARHAWLGAFLLVLAGAACAQTALPRFDPPRRVMCQESDRGLMGMSRNRLLTPISGTEFPLAGAAVRPPASGTWCHAINVLAEVQARVDGAPRQAVMFVRNNYGMEILSQQPPRPRLRHSFFVQAAMGAAPEGGIWTIESLRDLSRRVAAGSSVPAELRMTEVRRFGTDCLDVDMSLRPGSELRLHNQVLHCIHPADARYQVTLMVSEAWLDGSPFYTPPVMEAARGEYQPFLDSLRFTTPPEPRAQPPAPQRR